MKLKPSSFKTEIQKGLVKKGDNVTCSACGHTQVVSDKNIYQDIEGKGILCEKCHKVTSVEVEEE